jgi:hypothetical protein
MLKSKDQVTLRKKKVIVHFNYFWNFRVFLARQPQGVLLDRFPPFKPCANEFSLPFSYTKACLTRC